MEPNDIANIIEISQMWGYDRAKLLNKVLAAYPRAVLEVWNEACHNNVEMKALGEKYAVYGYNTEIHKKVLDLIGRNQFIEAIKQVRNDTGAGLAASKDLCDYIRDRR